jgi:hypothetical protein
MAQALTASMETFQAENPDMATAMRISSEEFHSAYQQKHRSENQNPQPSNALQMQTHRYACSCLAGWHCMLSIAVIMSEPAGSCCPVLLAVKRSLHRQCLLLCFQIEWVGAYSTCSLIVLFLGSPQGNHRPSLQVCVVEGAT